MPKERERKRKSTGIDGLLLKYCDRDRGLWIPICFQAVVPVGKNASILNMDKSFPHVSIASDRNPVFFFFFFNILPLKQERGGSKGGLPGQACTCELLHVLIWDCAVDNARLYRDGAHVTDVLGLIWEMSRGMDIVLEDAIENEGRMSCCRRMSDEYRKAKEGRKKAVRNGGENSKMSVFLLGLDPLPAPHFSFFYFYYSLLLSSFYLSHIRTLSLLLGPQEPCRSTRVVVVILGYNLRHSVRLHWNPIESLQLEPVPRLQVLKRRQLCKRLQVPDL